ncbi:MAG: hypothetical protein RSB41_02780 [Bacilli bacterium]
MINKIFMFVLGIILSSIGIVFIVIYMNLFTLGYNLIDYGKFIIKRIEVWSLLIGIIIIIFSFKKRKDKNI